ncbi:TBC1 domain family member 2A isoform X2 [Festucalex cinctus]
MEGENDSHRHSQSFFQGETQLEADSLFEQKVIKQDERTMLTSPTPPAPPPIHLDPRQVHLPAHMDPPHTSLPANLGPLLSPQPAQLDLYQTPLPPYLDSRQAHTPVQDFPVAQLDPHQASLPVHLDFHQTHLLAHLDPQDPSPFHSDHRLSAHLNSRETPPPVHPLLTTTPAHLDPHPAPIPTDLDPLQIATPSFSDPHRTCTSAHLDLHPTPPLAHLEPQLPAQADPHQTSLPTHLDPPQTPTPTYLDPHQTCTSAHFGPPPARLDPCQTPQSAHLDSDTLQVPLPAHLDPHPTAFTAQLVQTSGPAHHPDRHQTHPPAQLEPHQAPLSAHLDPTPAQPDPNQTLHLAQLDPLQSPVPAHPHPHQTPPPVELDPNQTPSAAHLDAPTFAGRSGEPKLCGFLQKQGGPLRAWKRRWFTYEEKQNQMFYYRSPQDVTPLGRVDLGAATFSYPLKAEIGTFHIETPERTYTLKALTQDLMLYWLQQLQLKRWHHRQTSACPDATGNIADDFLPLLKSPAGLVGEEAANETPPRTPLANMSIKHPFIQIQNTVHSLRKRSSQEWAQSVFYVPTPAGVQVDATPNGTASVTMPPAGPLEATREPLDTLPRKKKVSSSSRTAVVSSERVSRLQQDKEMLMEEVKAQKELVWLLHKTLEAAQREKRTCADFVAAEGEQERLELLRHRERQAADLLGRVDRAQAAAEAARRDLQQRDLEVAQLQDQVRKLLEKNHAKQEVITKLSDHMAACAPNPPTSTWSGSTPDLLRQLQQRIEDLKDDIEAYKTQNKFLNSEIFQLTKLWRKSSEQERSLMVKCAYLEAWHCQAESRYLGVLRKLQETTSLNPEQRRAIQKMVGDALQGQANKDKDASSDSLHDEYGFKIIPDYEVEDVKLLAKIQALEIRSHNLLQQEGRERPLLSRWAQYLAGRSDDDFCPSPELKGLLRAGVPHEYRQRVWRCLVRVTTRTARERHPQRYRQLCDKSRTCPHPASRQIQLDLHRTLTSNRHFSSPSSPAHQQLQRILLAFSWHDPSVGYCQGLNRLAAIALLVLQSEEDAFWCLVAVVDAIMPQDYYTKNLLAAQADQHVLKDFLVEKLPRLAAHFDLYAIDVSLVTFNWFLVVFVESLPSDILLPLWDAFLYEGTKVMFRYALALFKYKEDDILKINDGVDIYQYLRFFTKTVTDARKLMGMAFADMNPFPGRLLRNRRALHLERLQGEQRELEEQQKAFAALSGEDWSQQQQRRRHDRMDNAASEDDEEMG